MKKMLLTIIYVFGTLSLVIPLIIGALWNSYVISQQEVQKTEQYTGCAPYAFTIEPKDTTHIMVSWKTSDKCSGYLLLGQTVRDFVKDPLKIETNEYGSDTTTHSVTLTNRDIDNYYYAVVVSEDDWYGMNGQPFTIGSFR